MEEDDMDFTPTQNTSSNLASLFGVTEKPLQGNPSFTYTPPKAPKKEPNPTNRQQSEKKSSRILSAKAVQAYKLENKTYVNQGLSGIMIYGCPDSYIYEIILYKQSKETLTKIRIFRSFSFVLSQNNYASFYDENGQNWSIMFQSPVDVIHFVRQLAVCKVYCCPEPMETFLIQDLTPTHSQTDSNSVVDIIYSTWRLNQGLLTSIKLEMKERIKLSNYNFTPLSKGLIGCSENCQRLIIVPHSLIDFNAFKDDSLNNLPRDTHLLLEVEIKKIILEPDESPLQSKITENGAESPSDSSAEKTTVKARGASIKKALTNTKSQKANLISRMARMGQATLPVKESSADGLTDSEEEVTLTSPLKQRIPRSRVSANNSHQNTFISQPSQIQNLETFKQLSVYQNDLTWQQSQPSKLGTAYQQLIPVSASPVSSPTTDPNMSVYVSESRIQAAELRMGISKISEKIDLVLNKVQDMSAVGVEYRGHHVALMDSSGILSSIQGLITENESLKEKVEEQKRKNEQQSDRIFHLLELNHKYLEQNSASHGKQSEIELTLKTEIESLRKKGIQLEADNQKSLEKVKKLESDLSETELSKKKLKERVGELNLEVEVFKKNLEGNDNIKRKELEGFEKKMSRALETMTKMEEKLEEVTAENENMKSVIKVQREEVEAGKEEIKESKMKNEEYEKVVEDLRSKILAEESKLKSKVEYFSKVVQKLEEEKNSFLIKIEKEKENKDKEVNEVVNRIFQTLKLQFSDSGEYSSSDILSTIQKCFNDVISGSNCDKESVEEPKGSLESSKIVIENSSGETTILPKPRISLQKKENNESQPLQNEIKKLSSNQPLESEVKAVSSDQPLEKEIKVSSDQPLENEKKDNRYKSYDQSWRTRKPPPPPFLDDEDDEDDWLD